MLTRSPMIASTTSSSISVKPAFLRLLKGLLMTALPSSIGDAVEPQPCRGRIDVIDVVALLRVVRLARIAALAPGRGVRKVGIGIERIARNPAHEIDLAALGIAPVGDALDQG